MEPVIHDSARKHGVSDDDIRYAFDHPFEDHDLSDDFTMLVCWDRDGGTVEIGFVLRGSTTLIIHAMRPARPQFLR